MEEVKDLLLKQFKNEAFVGIDLENGSQTIDDSADVQEDHSDEDEDSEDDALFRKLFG